MGFFGESVQKPYFRCGFGREHCEMADPPDDGLSARLSDQTLYTADFWITLKPEIQDRRVGCPAGLSVGLRRRSSLAFPVDANCRICGG